LDLEYDNIVETVRNTTMLYPKRVKFIDPGEDIYTYYDKTRIKQALVNLIRNAIQATADTENPEVIVRVYKKEAFVYIEVQDNGPGIPDEILERIFEPKFTTKSSGAGLGLAIVKRIIESHEGDIIIETRQGEGTKFILILPLKDMHYGV